MAPQGEAPHIDGVFPMEDYHPANPIINANSSSVDSSSLATNASIGLRQTSPPLLLLVVSPYLWWTPLLPL